MLGVSALFAQGPSARRGRPGVGSGDHRSRNFQEMTKTRARGQKKSSEICVGANKNPGQAAGARQPLKVIFAIRQKAFAYGHMVRKNYRED